jgi:aminotransferase
MVHISERDLQLPTLEFPKIFKRVVNDPSVISLGPGEPDFVTPKPLIDYGRRILGGATHYSEPQGMLELREAIVKKLRKENNIHADASQVLVTCGSQEALFSSFLTALDPTEEVVVPSPGYVGYIPAIELVNGVPKFLQLREDERFAINPDALRKMITKKTKVIMVNSPSNPTGQVMGRKLMEEIAEVAVDKNVWIFSDEAYEHLTYGAKHHSIGALNGMGGRVVSFYTFSKSYAMCGFRLGYCVGPAKFIQEVTKDHHYVTLSAPHISQMIGVKALTLPKKYIHGMVREYKRRRDYLVGQLNELSLPTITPQGAFYTWSNISKYSTSAVQFSHRLLNRAKVAVIPGTEFGPYGEGYVRCSFATKYEKIVEGMERVEKELKQ